MKHPPDPAARNAIRLLILAYRLRRWPVLPDILARLADWIDP